MAIREVGQPYVFTYKEVKEEEDGWVSLKKFYPLRFDLVSLRIKRGSCEEKKQIPGWWTGEAWEGQKLKIDDVVIGWKQDPEAL
jgi:hypothetical protein